MDDSQLKSIVNSELTNALGSYLTGSSAGSTITASNNLAQQREKAMKYYLAQPFGNETEGRSQVISTDVMDTIEWIKPSLIRIFTMSDKAVSFEPVGPEDEEQADQETDYCNYVFYKDNNGFVILNEWFTDALLQKVGYVKLYPEKKISTTVEHYEGLDESQYEMLLADDELEPLAHEEYQKDLLNIGFPMTLHDLTVRRTQSETKVCITPIPPDEVLVSRKTLSIDLNESPFVAHRSRKTFSDLIDAGYDKGLVETIGPSDESDTTPERLARFAFDASYPDQNDSLDPSMKEVWVSECYLRVDYDEDGIAELRRVVLAGNQILENEETDMIGISALTPIILPHKHHGLSIADTIMDLQLWRSTLLRQILDNTYLANNQRTGVVEGQANLDDLLEGRMGGIVRMKTPSAIVPLPYNPLPPQTMALYELSESIKENRTGVTRYNQGTNADSLNKTATGINQIMTASQQRVELIARVFAETGVKDLFTKLHGMLIKYSDKQKIVRLRNKYVTVDPREWRNRYNVNISVGLGTGNKEQTVTSLVTLLNMQAEDVRNGGMGVMLTPQNLYHTRKKIVEAMGFKDGESFYTDPSLLPPPQPQPNPDMALIQAQLKIENDKRQVEIQKIAMQHAQEVGKLQMEREADQIKAQIDVAKYQLQLIQAQENSANEQKKRELEALKLSAESDLAKFELMLSDQNKKYDLMMEKYKTDMQTANQQHMQSIEMMNNALNAAAERQMKSVHKMGELHQKTTEAVMKKIDQKVEEVKPKKVTKKKATKQSDGSWTIQEE